MRHHIKKTIHITFGGVAVIVGLIIISGVIEYLLVRGNTIKPGVNAPDVANISYNINGAVFSLKDGVSVNESTSSPAPKNRLSLYGDPIYADFDQDGDIDAATVLVDETGIDGEYYYGVLVANDSGIFRPTNVIYLGNNISAPVVKSIDGHVVYSYTAIKGAEINAESSSNKSIWVNYDKKINQITEFNDSNKAN